MKSFESSYLSSCNTEKYGASAIFAGLDVVEESQARFGGILGFDEEQFVLLNLLMEFEHSR